MKNLDAIYFAVRELAPEDRPAYLTKACAGDHELRARVNQMLAVSAEAEAFITDLPDDEAEDRTSDHGSAKTLKLDPADAPDEAVGQTLGRYKLLERVGQGGCGVVYVAEQTEPVRRRVALKVIKLGMDTKQVVARFEAERQALAMMDHPNIAKVLDAEITGEGDPRNAGFPVGESSVEGVGGRAGWKTVVTGWPAFRMRISRKKISHIEPLNPAVGKVGRASRLPPAATPGAGARCRARGAGETPAVL